jgi:glycosyltransferase involved in cell wall biosynthesis
MRAALRQLVQRGRFDAVHADQLTMGQFALDLPVPRRVLDEHNAVWTIVQRAAAREALWPRRVLAELEWRKLRAYEGEVCRRFDWVTVVSDEDKQALEQAAGTGLTTETIPIAVDTEELAYAPRTPEAQHVLSVATMFYPPNVEAVQWFATDILPGIRRAMPSANFLVVGSRPPAVITALATPESNVQVMGYVADLAPLLRQSAVLVVPVHAGSGMRVKILEAFARGIPVVSTTVGVEGIAAQPGEHLLVADDPTAFAAAVVRLLQNPDEGLRLARAARALVEARYDWRRALHGLDRVYAGEASGGAPTPAGACSARPAGSTASLR